MRAKKSIYFGLSHLAEKRPSFLHQQVDLSLLKHCAGTYLDDSSLNKKQRRRYKRESFSATKAVRKIAWFKFSLKLMYQKVAKIGKSKLKKSLCISEKNLLTKQD